MKCPDIAVEMSGHFLSVLPEQAFVSIGIGVCLDLSRRLS